MVVVGAVWCAVAFGAGSTPVLAQQGEPGGSTGYTDRHVWAGLLDPPVEVATANTGRPFVPTHFCVRLPPPNQEAPGTQGEWTPEEIRALAAATPLDLTNGAFHTLICYRIGEDLPYLTTIAVWDPQDPTNGAITTSETVALYARELLDTPAPRMITSPPPDRLVVGLETWFASVWDPPPARTAQAGGLWATAWAVPEMLTVHLGGDVAPIRCPIDDSPPQWAQDPAGVPPVCLRHTFTSVPRASGQLPFTISATISYRIELIDNDRPTPVVVDEVDGDTSETGAVVREIQTVLR